VRRVRRRHGVHRRTSLPPLALIAKRSIGRLPELVAGLAPADRELFQRLFRLTVSEGRLRAPESMHGWLEERFGGVKEVERQRLVRVANRWTGEETAFNPLRGRRPRQRKASGPQEKGGDPLDRPLELTPEDVFGRIQGEHCLTAANVAKADGWHGVIIFREPDPLAFTEDSLRDCLETARRWWRTVHDRDGQAVYPLLFWNCGASAGASLRHAHVQVMVARGSHFGGIERLRAAAQLYGATHGSDYFRDIVRVHAALGCATTREGVAVLASLVPIKEREVTLIAPSPADSLPDVLYAVLDCYRDRLAVRSFNLALFAPPLAATEDDWRGFPLVVRLVQRSGSSGATSDIGGMELFAASVVSHDPFELAEALAASL
jgi:hypothetical protein